MPIVIGKQKEASEGVRITQINNAISDLDTLINAVNNGALTNAQRDQALKGMAIMIRAIMRAIKYGVIEGNIEE